jgi:NAD(P)-dependent dehydrogenase (short-subunit alcohol dehydrogenase family)
MLIFADYLKPYGVTINALHPGAVRSGTGRENGFVYRWIKKNVYSKMLRPTEIAAESIYYLGVSDEVQGITAKFFNLTTLEEPAPPALDIGAAKEIWAKSVEMTGIKDILSNP